MRIAALQFNPVLGDVKGNIEKADSLLFGNEDRLGELDLLMLPELAFAGYNHKSSADIEPYLEDTGAGPSTFWARKTARTLRCVVAVGYAEKDVSTAGPRAYNSLVFVNRAGEIIAHTRKRFLYYTDETWASEGQKFFAGELPLGSSLKAKKVAAGICMDINPYKFEAPWTSYEFANHALAFKAELVLLSTAWVTQFSAAELQEHASLPDLDTVGYWLERMRPLMDSDGPEQEVIIVFANRCGEEGGAPLTDPVRYAGSSTVMGISRGGGQVGGTVRIWDMLGRSEEGMLVVDTQDRAKYGLKKSMPAGSLGGEDAPRPSNDE